MPQTPLHAAQLRHDHEHCAALLIVLFVRQKTDAKPEVPVITLDDEIEEVVLDDSDEDEKDDDIQVPQYHSTVKSNFIIENR